MTKKIHPNKTNRYDVYSNLKEELLAGKAIRIESIESSNRTWPYKETTWAYSGSSLSLSNQMMGIAIAEWLQEQGANLLTSAISYGCWGAALSKPSGELYIELHGEDEYACNHMHYLAYIYGLSAQVGLSSITDWLGLYLNQLLENEEFSDSLWVQDKHFAYFMLELTKAHVNNDWPTEFDKKKLGGFSGLLIYANNPSEFNPFLPDYCDFRWANVYGWDSVDAKKKRNPNATLESSIFDGVCWTSLVPFELFALKYVYEKVTGETLSLDAAHPLLQQGWIKLPIMEKIERDKWIDMLDDMATKQFGKDWMPF